LHLVTKFHNTIIFGPSDTILGQRFLGIQQNQCFALFQRRRLCDEVISTLADEFGNFGAVFGTALRKEIKQLATRNMVVYPPIAKRFCYFDDEFLKKKRRIYDLDCFLLPDFLGY